MSTTEKLADTLPGTRRSTHDFVSLHGSSAIWELTPKAFNESNENDLGRTRGRRVGYLEGLRGLLAIQLMLWAFFRVLAPAIVTDTDMDGTRPAAFLAGAPAWQHGLRKGLSPLFFDGSLQANFFVILSGCVVVETFLERRNTRSLAGAVFRRPLRLLPPIAMALALVSVCVVAGAFNRAAVLAAQMSNSFAQPPVIWTSTIEYFNVLTASFFDDSDSKTSAAALFLPPRGSLPYITRIFMQSFTVYTVAILLPFTRTVPKFFALFLFGLTAWWIGSWAWYSLTGLAIAELVIAYDLPALAKHRIHRYGPPLWMVPAFTLAIGVALKYLGALLPEMRDKELVAHAAHADGSLNWNFDPSKTIYPRLDDWFVAASFLALLEMNAWLRWVLDTDILRFFGRISFPLYLTATTVFLSLGSTIYLHITEHVSNSVPLALAACFLACVPAAIGVATVMHFVVEEPSSWAARKLFIWMIEE